jgi:hypothetical protein
MVKVSKYVFEQAKSAEYRKADFPLRMQHAFYGVASVQLNMFVCTDLLTPPVSA